MEKNRLIRQILIPLNINTYEIIVILINFKTRSLIKLAHSPVQKLSDSGTTHSILVATNLLNDPEINALATHHCQDSAMERMGRNSSHSNSIRCRLQNLMGHGRMKM
jgi:hypothetical protein